MVGQRQENTTEQPLLDKLANDNYGSSASNDTGNVASDETETVQILRAWDIISILSTAFAYGCIMTTLFLITLPVECSRIQQEYPSVHKAVSLGIFVAIAGITQLISPLTGMLSDIYRPPPRGELGQRMPYLVLGSVLSVIGLLGQVFSSEWSLWIRYSFAFFLQMIGLNIVYSMMIALIPDQVPTHQTGMANGMLALLLVTGSLFGFVLFHSFLGEKISSMYGLYICIIIATTILTCTHGHERDVKLAKRRMRATNNSTDGPASAREEVIGHPLSLLQGMLVDPIRSMDWKTLGKSYTIDPVRYHDFFVVTVSRTFYYMGISVQTFFLYFVHDVIGIRSDPEAVVATLAILGQCAGAITCYPVGVLSDRLGSHRRPFVYLACVILASATTSLIFCTTMSQMTIICLILGGSNGMYLTMDTSLAIDTLPKDSEHEEGGSGHAQLLGVWGVAGFIGSALGPLIGGPLLYFFGGQDTVEGEEEEYSLEGYAVVLSLSSAYFLISAIILHYINPRVHT